MLQFDCINSDKSKVVFPVDAQIIRAAYLLGDVVRVSGSSFMAIDFENQFATPGTWLKKKMVLDFCARVPDPEYLKTAERMYDILATGKKNVKHPPTELIVARKKCEKALDLIFESSLQEMRNIFLTSGYLGLLPLEDEESLVMWGSSSLNPESSADGAVPYSEILCSKWVEEDELYAFTDTFWQYADEHKLRLCNFNETGNDGSVLIFPLPCFVPLAGFSATELKAIKQEIFGDMPEMRKAIEDWSLQLKTENFSPEKFDDYREYFVSKILSYVQTAAKRVEQCDLLTKVNDFYKGEVGFENYLGVTSVKTAMDFMEWSGMVPKESMSAFEDNLPEGYEGGKTILLLLSKSFNHQQEEEVNDKKSLEL